MKEIEIVDDQVEDDVFDGLNGLKIRIAVFNKGADLVRNRDNEHPCHQNR